ncbi:MAG: tetratricopeptide repeat protein [Gemmatimonadaceae bacterium]|nr:tetratricopeptide repeat protein [Gemmatimonadaceae bacterium]
MRIVRSLLVGSLIALTVATASAQGSDPIAKLEAARAKNPQNVAALRALGVAYYKAKRYADARTVLDQARRLDPKDGVSSLYAGLASEEVGDLTNAREAYNTYLQVGKTRKVRNEISGRLTALARREAIANAKAAVANEARLSNIRSDQYTIAVPPLRFTGPDTALAPLERGLAELMISDLSKAPSLTVVERDRMQALADEIRLGESGRVDAATAVRAGKLIQAGSIVSGTIIQQGSTLRLDALLVNVQTGGTGAPASSPGTLEQLFDMEKNVVFALFDQLRIQLTPAQRQAIQRRPTNNLQAFLAFSRGLQASDAGRLDEAARFFENARSLDPSFSLAGARLQSAQAAQASVNVPTSAIENSFGGSDEGRIVRAAQVGNPAPLGGGVPATLDRIAQRVNPPGVVVSTERSGPAPNLPERDAPSSTGGTDQPSRTGQVVIIIRRP